MSFKRSNDNSFRVFGQTLDTFRLFTESIAHLDGKVMERHPRDENNPYAYRPLPFYEEIYTIRANHPELYNENDLQELKGYLENIRKHLASKTKD